MWHVSCWNMFIMWFVLCDIKCRTNSINVCCVRTMFERNRTTNWLCEIKHVHNLWCDIQHISDEWSNIKLTHHNINCVVSHMLVMTQFIIAICNITQSTQNTAMMHMHLYDLQLLAIINSVSQFATLCCAQWSMWCVPTIYQMCTVWLAYTIMFVDHNTHNIQQYIMNVACTVHVVIQPNTIDSITLCYYVEWIGVCVQHHVPHNLQCVSVSVQLENVYTICVVLQTVCVLQDNMWDSYNVVDPT